MRIAVVLLCCALLRVALRPGCPGRARCGATAAATGDRNRRARDSRRRRRGNKGRDREGRLAEQRRADRCCPTGRRSSPSPAPAEFTRSTRTATITMFVENTDRANGLALDSKGRLIATTALTIDVLHPHAARQCWPRCRRGRTISSSTRRTASISRCRATSRSARLLHSAGRPGDEGRRGAGRAWHSAEPGREDAVFRDSGGEYLIAFDVQPDGKLTNKRNFGKYEGLPNTREPRRRDRDRQPGAGLRGDRDRRSGVQPEGRRARSDSDVAASAEPRVRGPRQEDALSHRWQRHVLGQDAGRGLQRQGEVDVVSGFSRTVNRRAPRTTSLPKGCCSRVPAPI